MREDMDKVIVERPRHGGGIQFPRGSGWRSQDFDLQPRREGMKRPWSDWKVQKHLNENLAPLRRFLQSNVGRPWRKVHSEIRERINMDSAVQLHIWQHVKWYVSEDVIVHKTPKGVRYEPIGHRSLHEFIVDPRNGLLVKDPEHGGWKRRDRYPRKREPVAVRIVEDRLFKKLEGVWFELRVGDVRKLPQMNNVFDVVTQRRISELSRTERRLLYGNETWFAKWKQQIGKREIRRLGLNEQPNDS